MINRVIVIVLDSFGIGESPDASNYGDVGANTLKGIFENTKLSIPNLKKLGLFNIDNINIDNKELEPIGIYGKAAEKSVGKNSPIGHWEISGFIKSEGFKVYPNAFPIEMMQEFLNITGEKGFLCNEKGSGTEILTRFGEEHVRTGYPIVYTSADSVFQIAAHTDVIPLDRLYEICEKARKMLNKPEYNVGTVIARPFVGTNNENFKRTYDRKDYEFENFGTTMLDIVKTNNKDVVAIGKINDLFSGRSITKSVYTAGNTDGINKIIEEIKQDTEGLIFANLVDFDMLYGHRNNIIGYAKALEEFDGKIPGIIKNMKDDDLLIITADHGCDPSSKGTDHTREYIPIIGYGKNIQKNVNIGIRNTFADISATILEVLDMEKLEYGESFKNNII